MRYDVEVNGTRRHVTVERRDGRLLVAAGERVWVADAAQAGANTLSLLLEEITEDSRLAIVERGSSRADEARLQPGTTSVVETHEIVLASDPVSGQFTLLIGGVPISAGLTMGRRWGSKDEGAAGAGPQRILAPMPGKVVRVLARPGEVVGQRQAIVVIEAMKMENELRAAHPGTLTELLVREGQSVEAGALLAVIAPR